MTSRRLARAQSRLDVVPGETPAEFRLGRCIEVWGTSNGEGDGQAWTRYLQGLRAYAATIGKDKIARPPCHFGSVPWSVTYLDDAGRGDLVDRALAEARVSRGDLPALRVAALGWVRAHGRSS